MKKVLFNIGNKYTLSEKKKRRDAEEQNRISRLHTVKNCGKHRQYVMYSFMIPNLCMRPLAHEK